MSRTYELFLRVREADEADYRQSIVRIHKANKPQDIKWGDNINISLDRKNWITCKLKPSGDIGIGKIYIGIHLRGQVNLAELNLFGFVSTKHVSLQCY